jgi:hypothetical protein
MLLLAALASWPPAAWAVSATDGVNVFGLPYAQMLGAGAVCVWGSLGRTNQRARAAKQDQENFEVLRELWNDIRRSSVIGAAIYLGGSAQGWDDWQMGGALLLAGYAGPAALDLWAAKFKGP